MITVVGPGRRPCPRKADGAAGVRDHRLKSPGPGGPQPSACARPRRRANASRAVPSRSVAALAAGRGTALRRAISRRPGAPACPSPFEPDRPRPPRPPPQRLAITPPTDLHRPDPAQPSPTRPRRDRPESPWAHSPVIIVPWSAGPDRCGRHRRPQRRRSVRARPIRCGARRRARGRGRRGRRSHTLVAILPAAVAGPPAAPLPSTLPTAAAPPLTTAGGSRG
jgi:hypothetical protein